MISSRQLLLVLSNFSCRYWRFLLSHGALLDEGEGQFTRAFVGALHADLLMRWAICDESFHRQLLLVPGSGSSAVLAALVGPWDLTPCGAGDIAGLLDSP